ncbi:MAG: hypothetical protein H6Q25_1057 [Bacteroidetes bacterium]|nr:hypothetical protein [Bacteroidota bacterium]
MKKFNLSVLLFFMMAVLYAQPQIKFDNTTYDFGSIKEEGGKVTGRFEFSNVGNQDLKLDRVQPGCGCTAANYTREPIPPGGRGFIDATYDPMGRPGSFHKHIKIFTNQPVDSALNGGAPLMIFIKGTVEKRPPTVYELAGYKEGNGKIRFKERMGKITTTNAQKAKYQFLIKNFSSESSPIDFINLPKHITVETSFGKVLKPDQEGTVTVIFDAGMKNQVGQFKEVIVVTCNDSIEKKIALQLDMDVKEDFSKYTPKQLQEAPVIVCDNDAVDFGTQFTHQQSEKVLVITNKGKTPLVIRQLIPSRSSYTVKMESMTINPGESAKLIITFNPRNLTGSHLATLDIVSNDPKNPLKTININAEVQPTPSK